MVWQSLLWALIALVAIFLPGLLLAVAGRSWLGNNLGGPALAGVNAAVVGVLGAALYNPVWVNAVHSLIDVVIVVAALFALLRYRVPPILIAVACVAAAFIT